MLKNILNLEGVQKLDRNTRKTIKGGGRELDPNLRPVEPVCNQYCEILVGSTCVPVCL